MARMPFDSELERVRSSLRDKARGVADALKKAGVRGVGEKIGNVVGRAAGGTVNAGEVGAKTAAVAGSGLREGAREGYQSTRPPPAGTATGPAPRTVGYGTDRASQGLRAADAAARSTPPPSGTAAPAASATSPRGTPISPDATRTQSPLRRLITPSSGVKRVAKLAAGLVGASPRAALITAVGTAGAKAFQARNTPTEEYAKRYGEKAGEGFWSDYGLRLRGLGEDAVNALNPLSDDTFGTKAKTAAPAAPTQTPTTTPPPAVQTPGQSQAEVVAANNERGRWETETELGRTPATSPLRNRITQTGPASFTNTPGAPVETDIGKPGGGLSVVGPLTPERIEAISAANADLQEAREAAARGISQEDYQKQKARHQREVEIADLQQNGLTQREATAALLTRDTELEKTRLEAEGKGGLDAGNLISLLGQQQDQAQHAESLGLRRNQFDLNQRIADDKTAAVERSGTARYIEQLNSDDPGVASAARGQLLQAFLQNPDSPEGRLLLSQASQALRQNSGEERGPIDALVSAWDGPAQFPADLTEGDFTLEPGLFGEGVSGTIAKDKGGQVLANLSNIPPEYAQAIKHLYAQRSQQRGAR